ncbi:ornithine cyclodeaminase family protein [Pseudomonas sp. SST3]|jgi:alanine dehydrogenase|uniref:ornithine cyclodeaminase family protein n=1 Tax=Pseudomonas sp. SST3 TaxID=2267882 RepID=UPI0019D61562|nr:NAD(P)-binding domain-containing protein [Pseudomonas sp. SST3]
MLFLNNDDVQQLLNMPDCVAIQEQAFLGLEDGRSIHRPRIDVYAPCEREGGYWRWGSMEGATSAPGPYFAIRMKSDVIQWSEDPHSRKLREDKYCREPGTYCGLILVFSTRNGEPLALINDGHLQHMRVGAGAGIGAKYLAREDASRVGIIGSGGMARTYLMAFCAVRPVQLVKVYSPNPAHRQAFAEEMQALLGVRVTAVGGAADAVQGSDIVATCTSSMVPTLQPEWLEFGMHVTNLGPFELSEALLERADIVIRQGDGGALPLK